MLEFYVQLPHVRLWLRDLPSRIGFVACTSSKPLRTLVRASLQIEPRKSNNTFGAQFLTVSLSAHRHQWFYVRQKKPLRCIAAGGGSVRLSRGLFPWYKDCTKVCRLVWCFWCAGGTFEQSSSQIIIKIDGNWKFFAFIWLFFATFVTIFRILCWMTVVLSDYLKTKQFTPCWERRSLRTESNEAGCIGKAARRFRQRWEAGNDIERRLRRFV